MKRVIATSFALCALAFGALGFSATAAAQGASLGAAYTLAMNASTDSSDAGKQIDAPDSGGGSIANSVRGSGDSGAPAKGGIAIVRPLDDMRHGDPGLPAAATPKRPTYRWQSLVPGAIK